MLQRQRQEAMLGGVGNVARNITTLGGRAILVGLLEADQAGREVRHLVGNEPGIVDALVESPTRPTTCKNPIVAARQQVIRVDDETAAPAPADEERRLMAAVEHHLDRVDAVVLSEYSKVR